MFPWLISDGRTFFACLPAPASVVLHPFSPLKTSTRLNTPSGSIRLPVRRPAVRTSISIDRGTTRDLYKNAFETAQGAGFQLSAEPLRLTPQDKLVEIVRRSQELALSGKGGDEAEKEEAAEGQ